MKIYSVNFKSTRTMAQGRKVEVPKLEKESNDAYELRTWREKLNYDPSSGEVYIPAFAIKNALAEIAKFLAKKIPGKGKETYTKYFETSIIVTDPIYLGVNKDTVDSRKLYVPSDGKRGGSKRVYKYFPIIPEWEGSTNIYVAEENVITRGVLQEHLTQAGVLIGFGSLRIRNNGIWGGFTAEIVEESGI